MWVIGDLCDGKKSRILLHKGSSKLDYLHYDLIVKSEGQKTRVEV